MVSQESGVFSRQFQPIPSICLPRCLPQRVFDPNGLRNFQKVAAGADAICR
jgi:hypothetical protein